MDRSFLLVFCARQTSQFVNAFADDRILAAIIASIIVATRAIY
jgi:hypothetical protein